jgi:hypothetical protein
MNPALLRETLGPCFWLRRLNGCLHGFWSGWIGAGRGDGNGLLRKSGIVRLPVCKGDGVEVFE